MKVTINAAMKITKPLKPVIFFEVTGLLTSSTDFTFSLHYVIRTAHFQLPHGQIHYLDSLQRELEEWVGDSDKNDLAKID